MTTSKTKESKESKESRIEPAQVSDFGFRIRRHFWIRLIPLIPLPSSLVIRHSSNSLIKETRSLRQRRSKEETGKPTTLK